MKSKERENKKVAEARAEVLATMIVNTIGALMCTGILAVCLFFIEGLKFVQENWVILYVVTGLELGMLIMIFKCTYKIVITPIIKLRR